MSSITISTAAVLSAGPATRLRLTARGRRLLVALASLPLAVGIVFAALSGGNALATGEAAAPTSFETVTVLPGDTLWSIAAEVAPESDPRDVIGEISRLNLIQGGVLQVGQEISIPAQYTE